MSEWEKCIEEWADRWNEECKKNAILTAQLATLTEQLAAMTAKYDEAVKSWNAPLDRLSEIHELVKHLDEGVGPNTTVALVGKAMKQLAAMTAERDEAKKYDVRTIGSGEGVVSAGLVPCSSGEAHGYSGPSLLVNGGGVDE